MLPTFEVIVNGLNFDHPPCRSDDPKFNAWHEAAHAVAAVKGHLDLCCVDIQMAPSIHDGQPFTVIKNWEQLLGDDDRLADLVVFALAGHYGEELCDSRACMFGGFQADIDAAAFYISHVTCKEFNCRPQDLDVTKERNSALLKEGKASAKRFVLAHAEMISLVASHLIERRTLTGDEVIALIGA